MFNLDEGADSLEIVVKKEVKDVVLGTDVYDNVEVGLNLVLDFNKTDITDHQYYVAEGQTQGYLDSESAYESESTGGAAAQTGRTPEAPTARAHPTARH